MLVVIEGIDGTGKGTVTKKLTNAINSSGNCASYLSFPRYTSTQYGKIVGRYLNGDFGSFSEHPLMHGTLFALDRFQSKAYLEDLLETSDFVICDRYVPSNLCYSSMIAPEEEKESVVQHFVDLEYGFFRMPRPDAIFILDMPVSRAILNIAKKEKREYTDRSADIFEADVSYLQKVKSFYADGLQASHPEVYFKTIVCEKDGDLLPLDEIVQQIFTDLFNLKEVNDGKEKAFVKAPQSRVCESSARRR